MKKTILLIVILFFTSVCFSQTLIKGVTRTVIKKMNSPYVAEIVRFSRKGKQLFFLDVYKKKSLTNNSKEQARIAHISLGSKVFEPVFIEVEGVWMLYYRTTPSNNSFVHVNFF